MGQALSQAVLTLLLLAATAQAHRLDEYLQAALILVERDQVTVELNLTPGVEVLPRFLAIADTDRDGALSQPEQQVYASAVQRDLEFQAGAERLTLSLHESHFAPMEQMREGNGSIKLILRATLPESASAGGEVWFHNRHEPRISVYLMNALAPAAGIEITSQRRDAKQTEFRLRYRAAQEANWTEAGWWALACCVGLGLARVAYLRGSGKSAPAG